MTGDICIYTRLNGKDLIWTLVIGDKRTHEMDRTEICDLLDQMIAYYRYGGSDDFKLETLSGPVNLNRTRVYTFGMEAISVMSYS